MVICLLMYYYGCDGYFLNIYIACLGTMQCALFFKMLYGIHWIE